MAYYIQGYSKGYIAREGDKYQYVTTANGKEKVEGTYASVEELVNAHPTSDGTQSQQGQRSVDEGAGDVLATASTPKATAKKTTKRSSKK